MRRILVCTGVLGGGTAIVFALAALTATLFPTGTSVSSTWNGFAQRQLDWVTPEVRPAAVFGGPIHPAGGGVTISVASDGTQEVQP